MKTKLKITVTAVILAVMALSMFASKSSFKQANANTKNVKSIDYQYHLSIFKLF